MTGLAAPQSIPFLIIPRFFGILCPIVRMQGYRVAFTSRGSSAWPSAAYYAGMQGNQPTTLSLWLNESSMYDDLQLTVSVECYVTHI